MWYRRNTTGISNRLSFRGFEASDVPYGLRPAKHTASFSSFLDRCLQRVFITSSLFLLILTIMSSSSRQTSRLERKCPSVVPPLPRPKAVSPNSFPTTPGEVTRNYLRSILILPRETKAWECFQRQRGEASWPERDTSRHSLLPCPCRTTKGS